jgi:hypothetical protein
MEWLLGDEDVWSGELDYPLKRATTFDPIVGSRLNFYRGFQRLLSDEDVWSATLSIAQKAITFDPTV